jgi:hypothetical protein
MYDAISTEFLFVNTFENTTQFDESQVIWQYTGSWDNKEEAGALESSEM